jgi:hypothetical protein
MATLKKMLGKDFACYKTDCIFYRDTLKNRELVQEYLASHNFTYKQLMEQELTVRYSGKKRKKSTENAKK